jgi:uncharacterized protein
MTIRTSAAPYGGPQGRVERRSVNIGRLQAPDDGLRVTGHAAVFGQMSEDLGGFVEVIQRGAFRPVLDTSPDVPFVLNHGSGTGLALARTTNGTLRLSEDVTGLRFVADLADTSEARDLLTLVRRGDVHQMSFAFAMDPERGALERWDTTDAGTLRTIIAASDLYEISAVTFPAYPQTDLEMAA